MGFGARLTEERKRLGLKQAEFAAMVGTDVPKQSLYENDHRALRAAYLAGAAAAGVDVLYVLTERRSEGPWLDEDSGRLVSAYIGLPPDLRKALVRLAGEVARASRETDPGAVGPWRHIRR